MRIWHRMLLFRERQRLTRDVLLRIVADALLINASAMTALALRFVWLAFERSAHGEDYEQILGQYVAAYLCSAWILTPICLAVCATNGFYTYGRYYRGRYKVLVVAQAVSLAYLIFGFLTRFIDWPLNFPRSALVLSWLMSAVVLISSRMWSLLWRSVVRYEPHPAESPMMGRARSVLVIGGAGYIGSALLPKLLAKGYRVRLLDMLLYGTEPIEGLLDHPRLEVVQADFRHVDKVVNAMQGMEAVVHLGAIVGDPACALDEDLTIEVNLMATRMIAEVAKGCRVSRFIFASTCSVYGANDELLNERSALNPVSLYARSKVASERVLLDLTNSSFAPTILRFGTIYGLSGRTRFDLVINLLTAKAKVESKITVMEGDQWRPFVHVDDAALAVFKVLEAPLRQVRDQVFNVGSDGQNYTISEIGELIHRLVPSAQVINTGSLGDRRNYRVDFSKLLLTLDFKPRWKVEDGVRQVIEAIDRGRVGDYLNAKYSNVKFLSEEGSYRLCTENGWARTLINQTLPEVVSNCDNPGTATHRLLHRPPEALVCS